MYCQYCHVYGKFCWKSILTGPSWKIAGNSENLARNSNYTNLENNFDRPYQRSGKGAHLMQSGTTHAMLHF